MRNIAVDQQDGVVELHRYAHGEVDRREGLPLPGESAGHHDEVTVLGLVAAHEAECVADDGALDDAELVGGLRFRGIGRKVAARGQGLQIDVDVLALRERCARGCPRQRQRQALVLRRRLRCPSFERAKSD